MMQKLDIPEVMILINIINVNTVLFHLFLSIPHLIILYINSILPYSLLKRIRKVTAITNFKGLSGPNTIYLSLNSEIRNTIQNAYNKIQNIIFCDISSSEIFFFAALALIAVLALNNLSFLK